jgi:hypothetical protein
MKKKKRKSRTIFDSSLSHNSSMIVTCRLLVSIMQEINEEEKK